jgi:hypothetical protein
MGAIAMAGIDGETAGPGGDGTVVIGDKSVATTDATEPVVAEAVTRDMWTDQVREQLRSEIQEETQAHFCSQIVAAELVTVEGVSELQPNEPPDKPPSWTPRKRMGLASFIALAAIIGIILGVLFAKNILGPQPEPDELRPVQTLEGQNGDDRFRDFVVFSRDGSTLAVGARDGDYVQVFRWTTNQWEQIGGPHRGSNSQWYRSVWKMYRLEPRWFDFGSGSP